jgi:hypothetical protein
MDEPNGKPAAALRTWQITIRCMHSKLKVSLMHGFDQPPENWTNYNVSSPNPGEENCNERQAARRGADHHDPEARRRQD